VTTKVAEQLVASSVAVTVTVVDAETLKCFTENLAVDCPAGIVTEAGTVASAGVELVNVTFNPPVGAGPERETVPVTAVFELPLTVEGETDSEASVTGTTVKPVCCELEP
jgi:hypothetical protein